MAFVGDVALLSENVQVDRGIPPLVANLEGPIGRNGAPAPGKVNLWSDEESFVDRLAPHLLAVSLANNHVLDFGPSQLEHTLHLLGDQGVGSYGLGTPENPTGGLLLEGDGGTLGLLGYACPSTHALYEETGVGSVRRLALEEALEDIRTLKKGGADHVVVTPHWGVEQVELPRPADVTAARAMIEGGATAVIGHHAHCIQGFEIYRGRTIVYGLGSSIWPDMALPAEFNALGEPTKTYRRRQRRWNLRALMAVLSLPSGEVEVRETRYKSGRLSVSGRSAERWNLTKRFHLLLDEDRFRKTAFRHMLRDRVASAWQEGTLWRGLDPRRVFRLLGDMGRTIRD
jgi:hypothetical protein